MKSFKEYLQEQRQIDESLGSWVGQGIDGITRRASAMATGIKNSIKNRVTVNRSCSRCGTYY